MTCNSLIKRRHHHPLQRTPSSVLGMIPALQLGVICFALHKLLDRVEVHVQVPQRELLVLVQQNHLHLFRFNLIEALL